jgi:hypothetical protein
MGKISSFLKHLIFVLLRIFSAVESERASEPYCDLEFPFFFDFCRFAMLRAQVFLSSKVLHITSGSSLTVE